MSSYQIKVAIYTVRIKKSFVPEYTKLDNIADTGDTLLGHFKEFVKSEEARSIKDDDSKETFAFNEAKLIKSGNEKYFCNPEYGKYGIGGSLRDADTGEVKHQRKKNESDTRPYTIGCYVPADDDVAFLAFQRYGNSGIASQFKKVFPAFIREKYERKWHCEINPYMSRDMAKRYIKEAAVKKVIFRNYNVPGTKFKKYGFGKETEEYSVDVVVNAQKKRYLSLNRDIDQWLDNRVKLVDIPSASNFGITRESQVILETQIGKSRRRMSVNELNEFKPAFDVHDDLVFDANNIPTFKSMRKVMKGLFKDIKHETYG